MSASTATVNDLQIQRSETAQSMKQIVFRQFLEHRMAVFGAILIFILSVMAIGAPLIAAVTGISPDRQNVSARYLQPFQKAVAPQDQRETEIDKWIVKNPESAEAVQKELIAKGLMSTAEKDAIFELGAKDLAESLPILKQLETPASQELTSMFKSWQVFHLFGTDEIGRDVFIRLLYGTRVSMGVGVLVALASALIGFLIGAIAGFYGGAIDTALMRITDALLSLPIIPVLIVFAAIDLQKIPWLSSLISGANESIFKMVIILCLFSWMTVARLVRGSILSLREREFILAARTLGATDLTIIGRHLFPNVIAPMLVSITLGVGESILFEAALSFLGLGIMPPTASWGNMLTNAQEVIYNNVWLAVLPGLLILITVVSFNFLGDGLQDAMDPKAIRR